MAASSVIEKLNSIMGHLEYEQPPKTVVKLINWVDKECWECILSLRDQTNSDEEFFFYLRPFFRDYQAKYIKIIEVIEAHGYGFGLIKNFNSEEKKAYIYHDTHPEDLFAALALIDVNNQYNIRSTFFLNWMYGPFDQEHSEIYSFLREFEGESVEIGLHTFAFASWLIWNCFSGDERRYNSWVRDGHAKQALLNFHDGSSGLFGRHSIENLFQDVREHFSTTIEDFRQVFPNFVSINPHGTSIIRVLSELKDQAPELYSNFHGGEFISKLDLASMGINFNVTQIIRQHQGKVTSFMESDKIDTYLERLDEILQHDRPVLILNHPANLPNERLKFSTELKICSKRTDGSVLKKHSLDLDRAVYVSGLARGGTAWLRRTLNTHPQLQELDNEINFNHLGKNLNKETIWKTVKEHLERFPAPASEKVVTKCPLNALVMRPMSELLPEASFLFIIRDPRDVAVSYKKGSAEWMNRFKTVENSMKVTREYYEGFLEARDCPNVKHIKYEQLHQNFRPTFEELCEFIGISSTPYQIYESMHKSSFSSMYGRKHNEENVQIGARKGVVGDWLNSLCFSDATWFREDPYWSTFLEENGYHWDFPTIHHCLNALQEQCGPVIQKFETGTHPGISIILKIDIEVFAKMRILIPLKRIFSQLGDKVSFALMTQDIMTWNPDFEKLVNSLSRYKGATLGIWSQLDQSNKGEQTLEAKSIKAMQVLRSNDIEPTFVAMGNSPDRPSAILNGLPVLDMTQRWGQKQTVIRFEHDIGYVGADPEALDLWDTRSYTHLKGWAVRVVLDPFHQPLCNRFALGFRKSEP